MCARGGREARSDRAVRRERDSGDGTRREDERRNNGFNKFEENLAENIEVHGNFRKIVADLGAYHGQGPVAPGCRVTFTSNDVVFTIKMLQEHAPTMTWSIDMRDRVAEVTAPDDLTVVLSLSEPNPRFMFNFFAYHFDIGIPIVPAHIWEGENPEEYTFIDVANGIHGEAKAAMPGKRVQHVVEEGDPGVRRRRHPGPEHDDHVVQRPLRLRPRRLP